MNMNKEYRAELRQLDRKEKGLCRAYNGITNESRRRIAREEKLLRRAQLGIDKHLEKIKRRRAVLAGRLGS